MIKKIISIAVIGEGITEKHYIKSLKSLSDFTITPRQLGNKASSLKGLEKSINESIKQKYKKVYCLIDMDGKRSGKSKVDYDELKQKYHKIHIRKGNEPCEVVFIETERCTELWFLYHFTKNSITREFSSYNELEKALQKHLPNYEKTDKYLRGNLHKALTAQGSLKQAIENSKSSITSKEQDERDYTYSEIHLLIEALSIKI